MTEARGRCRARTAVVRSGYGEAAGRARRRRSTLQPGEIFALLGKNGMGKSTLLKTVMGFLPMRGRAACGLFGEDITHLPPHRVAAPAIAYTPQEQALFQDLHGRGQSAARACATIALLQARP